MALRIAELIDCLRTNPDVLGLVRYGSRIVQKDSPGGDFDLFAFVREREPDLESIHFYWGETPVDLSLRTLEDLDGEKPVSYIDLRLAEGEILFDRMDTLQGLVATAVGRWAEPMGSLPESEVFPIRFYQSHVLNKVRGRLEADPVLCEMLLSINITWLLHIYYKVRREAFPGEKAALDWVRRKEPDMARRIEEFFLTRNLELKFRLSEELTDLVLEPIGGPWKRGEMLGLTEDSRATDLQRKAEATFGALLRMSPEEAIP